MKPDLTNEDFFKSTFDMYFGRIVSFCQIYLKDRASAENIAQDTFISFWENIDTFDRERSPLPYLHFIAKNKSLNLINRRLIEGKFLSHEARKSMELSKNALKDSSITSSNLEDIMKIVSKSMEQMSPKIRETFYLSRSKGLKNLEIAQKLNISVKTVETRMTGAFRLLRKNLKEFIGK